MTLSPEYLAGLMDGEAWIGIGVYQNPQARAGVTFRPTIGFTMQNDEGVLKEIAQQFECTSFGIRKSDKAKYLIFQWQKAKRLLEFVKPYLRIKKKHAQLLTNFFSLVEQGKKIYGGRARPDGFIQQQVEIALEIRKLTRKHPHNRKDVILTIRPSRQGSHKREA